MKFLLKTIGVCLLLFVGFFVYTFATVDVPKLPDDVRVARYVIRNTYDMARACGDVISAFRRDNGSIRALCSNGESYVVGGKDGRNVALRCKAGLC